MRVEVSQVPLAEVDADLLAVGLFEDAELPGELAGAPGAADAKGTYKRLALLHPERPGRALAVGLGKRDELEPERARVAAALAAGTAMSVNRARIAWGVPDGSRP